MYELRTRSTAPAEMAEITGGTLGTGEDW